MLALATAAVPLFAGWLSDVFRRRGGSRRAFVAAGVVIDVGALGGDECRTHACRLCALLIVATIGANVALSAYQVLLPESVPRPQWGVVSGIRGASTLLGAVLGFAIAGSMPDPTITFEATAVIMAVGALSLLKIGEGRTTPTKSKRAFAIGTISSSFLRRARWCSSGSRCCKRSCCSFFATCSACEIPRPAPRCTRSRPSWGRLSRAFTSAYSPIARRARSSPHCRLRAMAIATIGFALGAGARVDAAVRACSSASVSAA